MSDPAAKRDTRAREAAAQSVALPPPAGNRRARVVGFDTPALVVRPRRSSGSPAAGSFLVEVWPALLREYAAKALR